MEVEAAGFPSVRLTMVRLWSEPVTITRNRHRGSAIILFIGVMIVFLMFSALCIDFAVAFTFQNRLQSVADAASLAAARQLFISTSSTSSGRQSDARSQAQSIVQSNDTLQEPIRMDSNQDVQFGFINSSTRQFSSTTFGNLSSDPAYSFTGGVNAARVVLRKSNNSPSGGLPTTMARMVGINTLNTAAGSVALMDTGISQVRSGLRPFFGCWAQYQRANLDGNPRNNVAQIYGSLRLDGSNVTGCPSYTAGNWGFADLRDGNPGAPGNSTLGRWIQYGFGGAAPGQTPPAEELNGVNVNQQYLSTQPGNAISSNNVRTGLDELIQNQTVITIPLIDTLTGSGSNSRGRIVGWAGFVITRYVSNGPSSGRLIEGYYTRMICTTQCSAGEAQPGGGLAKLRLSA